MSINIAARCSSAFVMCPSPRSNFECLYLSTSPCTAFTLDGEKYVCLWHDFRMRFTCVLQNETNLIKELNLKYPMFKNSTLNQCAPPFLCEQGLALIPLLRSLLLKRNLLCLWALTTPKEFVLKAELSLSVSRVGLQEGLSVFGKSACAGCSCIFWWILISASCSVFRLFFNCILSGDQECFNMN